MFLIRMPIFIVSALLILAFSILGCSTKKSDSSNLRTTGINAHFEIIAIGGNVTCRAQFNIEGDRSNIVELSGGDTVTCNGTTMGKSGNYYTSTLSYTPGGTYTVVFTRSGENPYSSTVVLPEAPVISAPTQGSNNTKGQTLNVTWTPSSTATDYADVTLYSANHVSSTINDTAPESGAVSFGTNQTNSNPVSAGTWSTETSVIRYREGSMATGLLGSIIASNKTITTMNLVD